MAILTDAARHYCFAIAEKNAENNRVPMTKVIRSAGLYVNEALLATVDYKGFYDNSHLTIAVIGLPKYSRQNLVTRLKCRSDKAQLKNCLALSVYEKVINAEAITVLTKQRTTNHSVKRPRGK